MYAYLTDITNIYIFIMQIDSHTPEGCEDPRLHAD